MNEHIGCGIGINLRLELIDDILRERPTLPFFEIIVDNWFSTGPHHKKLEEIRNNYDISFHSVGMNLGGVDDINYTYLDTIKSLRDIYKPFHISDHLCFQAHGGNHHHDLLPFPLNSSSLKSVTERVNRIQDYLGENILIENLSYYVEFKNSSMSEIEFLNELNRQTGCLYLLDLNNIWVNSKNLNHSMDNYLQNLDWKLVKEVHMAGPDYSGEIYIDTHGSNVNDELLNIVNTHQGHLRNIPIIYERDTNLLGLSEMINQVELISESLNG